MQEGKKTINDDKTLRTKRSKQLKHNDNKTQEKRAMFRKTKEDQGKITKEKAAR